MPSATAILTENLEQSYLQSFLNVENPKKPIKPKKFKDITTTELKAYIYPWWDELKAKHLNVIGAIWKTQLEHFSYLTSPTWSEEALVELHANFSTQYNVLLLFEDIISKKIYSKALYSTEFSLSIHHFAKIILQRLVEAFLVHLSCNKRITEVPLLTATVLSDYRIEWRNHYFDMRSEYLQKVLMELYQSELIQTSFDTSYTGQIIVHVPMK